MDMARYWPDRALPGNSEMTPFRAEVDSILPLSERCAESAFVVFLQLDIHTDTIELSGCNREAANRTNRLTTFTNDTTGIIGVKTNFIKVAVSRNLVENARFIGVVDQLNDHVFEKLMNGETCFHFPE